MKQSGSLAAAISIKRAVVAINSGIGGEKPENQLIKPVAAVMAEAAFIFKSGE